MMIKQTCLDKISTMNALSQLKTKKEMEDLEKLVLSYDTPKLVKRFRCSK